jgi:HrpA-like RNA helicase
LADDLASETQDKKQVVSLPLYGSLPYQMQARVFEPKPAAERNVRRAIFATNIAETSVTVPEITHVIDCGFAKLPFFDARTGFDRLIVSPISHASARQRAGRSGRVHSGKCYRLYTEKYMMDDMQAATPPEILRSNLTGFILTLKALGIHNVLSFDLMDLPSVDALSHGLECLYALGAVDDKTNLTSRGIDMSAFPTEPRVSRMLLESLEMGCSWEVLAVASALQVRSLFLQPRTQRQKLDYDAAMSNLADRSGDHVTYSNLIAEMDDREMDQEECKEKFVNRLALVKAIEVRNQLSRFLRRYGRVKAMGITRDNQERSEAIRKCVTAGFFFNVAKLANDGNYYTVRGKHLVTCSQSSVLHSHGDTSEYIVFGETHDGSRGGIEIRSCSTISARWLRDIAPHYWA